jgi:hypothetical protein
VSIAVRAAVTLAIVACADGLAFAPAVFRARYRTPRHILQALVIAGVLTVVTAAVIL